MNALVYVDIDWGSNYIDLLSQKYSKFLEYFVEHKLLIYDEWHTIYNVYKCSQANTSDGLSS